MTAKISGRPFAVRNARRASQANLDAVNNEASTIRHFIVFCDVDLLED